MKTSSLIRSIRLRTLPLSASGVICGGVFACATVGGNWWLLIPLGLTAILLQVLANLCNELGDVRNGVDDDNRVGQHYGLNGGSLTEKEMVRAIYCTALLCALCGLTMINLSYGNILSLQPLVLLLLGGLAIAMAVRYTLGSNPYGYRGLGDIMVFLFFGILSVMGGYLVVAHTLCWRLLWIAVGCGLLSVAVLNINNIRDVDTDRGHRRTFPIRHGVRNAKIYQSLLVVLGWFCYYIMLPSPWHLLVLPLYIWHLYGTWHLPAKSLDRMLPLLSVSVLLTSLIFIWLTISIQ